MSARRILSASRPAILPFTPGPNRTRPDWSKRNFSRKPSLLRGEGVTEQELKRAKAKVMGQKKIARQDLGSFAMTTALDELYGLGYAYTDAEDAKIEAVTPDQVKVAAQKYLKPDALVISVEP